MTDRKPAHILMGIGGSRHAYATGGPATADTSMKRGGRRRHHDIGGPIDNDSNMSSSDIYKRAISNPIAQQNQRNWAMNRRPGMVGMPNPTSWWAPEDRRSWEASRSREIADRKKQLDAGAIPYKDMDSLEQLQRGYVDMYGNRLRDDQGNPIKDASGNPIQAQKAPWARKKGGRLHRAMGGAGKTRKHYPYT